MAKLTIVGLGPGPADLLTREAYQVLDATEDLYVRTLHHPVVPTLPRRITITSFDDLADEASQDCLIDQNIADRVSVLARRPEGVVYAVPGSPMDGGSVRELIDKAASLEIPVRLVAGISLLDLAFQSLRLDPRERGLQLVDALSIVGWSRRNEGEGFDPFRGDGRALDPTRPALVVWYCSEEVARTIGRALSALYPDEHVVSVVRLDAQSANPVVWSGTIEQLGGHLGQPIACIYLPPLDRLQDVAGFDTLRYIVARLRAPDGCPWDREQTHQSMKKHFIEETYEAIAALDEDEWDKFAEELGDVLLQVIMHSQLGREERRFDLEDVLRAVNEKLIRRHPHVFGNVQVGSSADVLRNWEKIKRSESGVTKSSFASIPQSIPALMRADAVQSRAVRYGWPPPTDVPDVARLERAARASPDRARQLLGRALFDLVALARRLDVDPEESLRQATNQFAEWLEDVLEALRRADSGFDTLSPDERGRRISRAFASRASSGHTSISS